MMFTNNSPLYMMSFYVLSALCKEPCSFEVLACPFSLAPNPPQKSVKEADYQMIRSIKKHGVNDPAIIHKTKLELEWEKAMTSRRLSGQ